MRLDGKIALITGAASGIGRASAVLFAREGAKVSVIDLDERGEDVVKEIEKRGGEAFFIKGDVSSYPSVKRMLKEHVERYDALDILFNNAGIHLPGTILTLTEEQWDRILAVNLKSVFLFSKEAMPLLARRGGVIINTASSWGLHAAPNAAAYCASKGGVILLTRAMALDHVSSGVRINCICPGPILTPLVTSTNSPEQVEKQAKSVPMQRLGTPDEVANAALFLATSESSFAHGSALVLDGGQMA